MIVFPGTNVQWSHWIDRNAVAMLKILTEVAEFNSIVPDLPPNPILLPLLEPSLNNYSIPAASAPAFRGSFPVHWPGVGFLMEVLGVSLEHPWSIFLFRSVVSAEWLLLIYLLNLFYYLWFSLWIKHPDGYQLILLILEQGNITVSAFQFLASLNHLYLPPTERSDSDPILPRSLNCHLGVASEFISDCPVNTSRHC